MARIGNHKNTTKKGQKYQPKLVGTRRKFSQFARRTHKKTVEEQLEADAVGGDDSSVESVEVEEQSEQVKQEKKPKKVVKKNVSVCLEVDITRVTSRKRSRWT